MVLYPHTMLFATYTVWGRGGIILLFVQTLHQPRNPIVSALFKALLSTAQAGELWIANRNFCTREFLAELDSHGAFFVIREHQGLPVEIVRPLGAAHRLDTGQVAVQRVRLVDANGHVHQCRRLRLTRKEATRDGDTLRYILTNRVVPQ